MSGVDQDNSAENSAPTLVSSSYNLNSANVFTNAVVNDAQWAACLDGGDFGFAKDSILPREFRQRLFKHFAHIEREYEREYRRLYDENMALQERLEKFEDGDHAESMNLAKKRASMLSQRLKQQYKQSTSRLVSSLRQTTGHSIIPTSALGSPSFSGAAGASSAIHLANGQSGLSSMGLSNLSSGSSWKLVHRVISHRDGIWEVSAYRRFLATASADMIVRFWSNDAQLNCLFTYTGHSGSVNSVRFRSRDHLMLTSSGDGAVHLVRLPFDLLVKAALLLDSPQPNSTVGAAMEAIGSAMSNEVAGSTTIAQTSLCMDADDGLANRSYEITEEGRPTSASFGLLNPVQVRHPHAIFQSTNLGNSMSSDSSPLSAADFLTGRDQIVSAGWDHVGRIYDLSTGQEVVSLTGHDHQLTDVRCSPDGSPLVVTSSRDCTFRLWDFRQPGMRVHVQQAHTQSVSTTQFIKDQPTERLVSAGGDRLCRIWDLRQTRGPLFTIRTDAGINRFCISGSQGTLSASISGDSVAADPTPTDAASTDAIIIAGASGGSKTSTGSQPPGRLSAGGGNPLWTTNYTKIIALPLDNRNIKLYDLNGNRISRLARSSSHGHDRMVTSVTWADEGLCNFFSAGFDASLFGWQIQLGNL